MPEKISLGDKPKPTSLEEELVFLDSNYDEFSKKADFNPYEQLDSIKKMPLVDKKNELPEYKKQLNEQKEGIAELQMELERKINSNFKAPVEDLVKIAKEYQEKFKLAGYQVAAIKDALRTYLERRNKVEDLVSKYKDAQLFEFLFGVKPKGKIIVQRGPMSLTFRCQNNVDFAVAFHGGHYSQASQEMLQHIKSVAGCLVEGIKKLKDFDNLIILEKDAANETITIHEAQHTINHLDLWGEINRRMTEGALLEEFEETDVTNDKVEILKKVWLSFIEEEHLWDKLRDEIICYYKDGSRDVNSIYETLIKPKSLGGIYDYMARQKQKKEKDLLNKLGVNESNENSDDSKEKKALLNLATVLVLENDYSRVIRKALESLYQLDYFFNDRDKAINLLLVEPLLKWEKVVDRIVNQKVKK
ncbi:MAG: hypothetical protein NTV62_01645 [Candidatus Gribaldobacteria bacterium]|nr:hypothetical protein [Candidatus Gribaldobacteria bacterium]